jgi:hypothetical protein
MDECAIPMCGGGEDESAEMSGLTSVCPNGHKMHQQCIRGLLGSTFPSAMLCPLCRDGSLNSMVVTTMPTTVAMMCTPFSAVSSVVAMRIGVRELLR